MVVVFGLEGVEGARVLYGLEPAIVVADEYFIAFRDLLTKSTVKSTEKPLIRSNAKTVVISHSNF